MRLREKVLVIITSPYVWGARARRNHYYNDNDADDYRVETSIVSSESNLVRPCKFVGGQRNGSWFADAAEPTSVNMSGTRGGVRYLDKWNSVAIYAFN